jgi:hypothetical protein
MRACPASPRNGPTLSVASHTLLAAGVTDWLQAIGEVLGALFAAVAGVIAYLVLRHEIRGRRADDLDRLASQARLILPLMDVDGERGGQVHKFRFAIRNFSDGVILHPNWRVYRVDTGEKIVHNQSEAMLAGAGIGVEVELDTPIHWEPHVSPPALVRQEIVFTDVRGTRWKRTDQGQPQRTAEDATWDWSRVEPATGARHLHTLRPDEDVEEWSRSRSSFGSHDPST